jgi:hypothetical protein
MTQLAGLERGMSRRGRDSIDHAPGGHGDICERAGWCVGACVGHESPIEFAQPARNLAGMARVVTDAFLDLALDVLMTLSFVLAGTRLRVVGGMLISSLPRRTSWQHLLFRGMIPWPLSFWASVAGTAVSR